MVRKKKEEPRPLPQDVTMLDELIKKCFEQLVNKVAKDLKLGDFLKMVEMRAKMFRSESEQVEFWKMLAKVREEVLAKKATHKEAASPSKKAKSAGRGK